MLSRRTLLAAPTILTGLAPAARAEETALQDWHDPSRNRTVPVRLRLPRSTAPAPAVLISHGLGGSRDGLAYLGEALAAAGFVAIHLQHPGSDSRLWQSGGDVRLAFAASLLDVRNALDRLKDVVFALDELPRRLHGRVDPASVAIAGHSFGAWTATHVLGERLPAGDWGLAFPDKRVKAGIALSPIPPLGISPRLAYTSVTAPILYITGTNDYGLEGTTPADRTIAFDNATSPAVMVMLQGASHASFAGEPAAGPRWNDPTYQDRTARLSVLFLRTVLEEDPAARDLLLRGSPLAPGDTIRAKHF